MYKLIFNLQVNEQGKSYRAYGIAASDGQTIEDISAERRPIKKMVHTINRLKLDPVHFRDVVEDYLLRNYNRI